MMPKSHHVKAEEVENLKSPSGKPTVASEVPLEADFFLPLLAVGGKELGPCFQHVLVGKLDFYDGLINDT